MTSRRQTVVAHILAGQFLGCGVRDVRAAATRICLIADGAAIDKIRLQEIVAVAVVVVGAGVAAVAAAVGAAIVVVAAVVAAAVVVVAAAIAVVIIAANVAAVLLLLLLALALIDLTLKGV